jgi:hypothetical protein
VLIAALALRGLKCSFHRRRKVLFGDGRQR